MARSRFTSATRRLAGGIVHRLKSSLPRRPRPAILMYHRIATERFDPWGLAASPERFDEQLQWLKANRVLLSLEEFAARHRDHSLPEAATAITFDDGYSCSATAAAPLLNAHSLPATIFLPVELIERREPFWWDELQQIVLATDRASISIGGRSVSLGEKRPGDADWRPERPPQTPRQSAFESLWAQLKPLTPDRIRETLATLREEAELEEAAGAPVLPMNPEQVRSTASESISFGSHALTHPWLTGLDTGSKAREIGESLERCERLTGKRPSGFAYPYGNFDAESERLAAESGFDFACATLGTTVSDKSHLFALPRVQVGNWNSAQLARALAAAP